MRTSGVPLPDHWRPYAEAILRIHARPPSTIDLRLPVPPTLAADLARAGLSSPFAIITAENPATTGGAGVPARPATDEQRTTSLRARLDALQLPYVPADGASPDGAHVERGFAIATDRGAATALARDFDQSALYWFDGARFWILPALTAADHIPLPYPA